MYLERNVALNGLTEQVRTCRMGLSDRISMRRFTTELGCVNHVMTDGEEGPSIDVPVTTLDDLVGADVPVLIKIDVEGHERAVLRGAERTLADRRLLAVIMETNGSGMRYGVSDDELVAIMRGHDFIPYSYEPFARQLVDVVRADGNTVFVREPKAVTGRITTARRFRLNNGEI